ncbi:aminodeoxychorismate synthase component I [Chloroflexia bacterium SDU3-3]|nr:aminodeoxychorismate synthase component I [Chloroflexia bacterium SDU3-3]
MGINQGGVKMEQQAVGRVVLRDGAGGRWLEFSAPRQILTTDRIDEVLPLVRQIEALVEETGLHAAGFIAYEAAPAFDPRLPVRPDGAFPLIWFGLFQHVGELDIAAIEQPQALAWRPSVTREEYERRLRAIREYIVAGDTYQVNFTYRLQAEADVDPWQLFAQIAGDGAAPYAAFVDTGEWAICSASPELFLRIDGEQIESRPMKGTAARGLWPEEDHATRDALLASEKDRAENVMIVDMVRNDLGRVAELGSVHVPALFSAERYPTVWQLTSTVAARSHAPLERVLQATFPPASITGAPKRRTMEIIAELETTPRRIYTGAIGFFAPGRQAQLNVAIRTVLLHRPTRQAEYGVGGGVVWDSTAAGEYEESLTKARVLTPRPRDFDLLETMRWSPEGGYALLEHHLARLARSADYFGFRIELPQIRSELAALAAGLPAAPHRVRLLLARAGAVACQAVALGPEALRFGDLALAAQPIDRRDVFLYHKTTRRIVYEEALRLRPGQRDVLLFNEDGHATETTVANIAVEVDGTLYTPPVSCGLLAGTQRAWLLQQGRLRERVLSVQDVLCSPRVYLLNSVRGMQQVQIVG